jgi:hypothetical protein
LSIAVNPALASPPVSSFERGEREFSTKTASIILPHQATFFPRWLDI